MQTLVYFDAQAVIGLRLYDPLLEPPLPPQEPGVWPQLFDVTGLNPQPQVGWLVSNLTKDGGGKITAVAFSPPPPPTQADLVSRLQALLHTYIYAHYDLPTQNSLIAFSTGLQAILINPAASAADKAAASAKIAVIMPAWAWVQSVLAYYYSLKGQLEAGSPWNSLDLNFAGHFDATDPQVALQNFVTAV